MIIDSSPGKFQGILVCFLLRAIKAHQGLPNGRQARKDGKGHKTGKEEKRQ